MDEPTYTVPFAMMQDFKRQLQEDAATIQRLRKLLSEKDDEIERLRQCWKGEVLADEG